MATYYKGPDGEVVRGAHASDYQLKHWQQLNGRKGKEAYQRWMALRDGRSDERWKARSRTGGVERD